MEKLLIHACCAPCSTVPLERLKERYQLAVFFHGSNIFPEQEYRRRLLEQRQLCQAEGVEIFEAPYAPEEWQNAVEPFRDQPESSHGERCQNCYLLRMRATAELALQEGFDLFTMTLSVSRFKSSKVLARLGAELVNSMGANEGPHLLSYLPEDFGKRDGFGLSVRRSRELGLYRQDYCGCELSWHEAERRRARKEASGR